MSILPKLAPLKISARFCFISVDKINLKCLWKEKETRIAKTILTKKSKMRNITLPDTQFYHIPTLIKTV